MTTTEEIRDPLPVYRFYVEIENVIEGAFVECSGLNVERELIKHPEGGVNDHEHMLAGRTKYPNLVLKRGITNSDALWKWYQDGLHDGIVRRENLSILLLDREGNTIRRWNVQGAFPIKWNGPSFNVSNSQVAVESIELAHHGLEMVV